MALHHLDCDLWVPAPLDTVWKFFCDFESLAKITPPRYRARIKKKPAALLAGERVVITMAPLGVGPRLSWTSRFEDIVETGDKRHFVDVQESGPFHSWKHTHICEAGSPSVEGARSNSQVKLSHPGTWIRDRVEYSLPLGFLGEIAHRVQVRRDLETMFAHRHAKLREIFATP